MMNYTPSRGRRSNSPAAANPPTAPRLDPTPGTSAAASAPAYTLALADLLFVFSTWLEMPDTGSVEITLGTYAANRLPGDPVWLALIGPPSSGKGETLAALGGMPDLYAVGTITESGLLSGVKASDRADDAQGGLLMEMGGFGILLAKDFTSILSMSRDTRTAMLAALREIFDGSWTRRLGVDGGRCLSWRGKMGLIAGVTQAIDSHHAVMAAMGPRFMFYRMPSVDAQAQARRALSHCGDEAAMREELQGEVQRFFAELDLSEHDAPHPTRPEINSVDTDLLVSLVEFVSCCRSAVERDSYSREVVLVPQPEAPARLVRSAAQLLAGLEVIGVQSERRRYLIRKVLLDSVPPVRRAVLDFLAHARADGSAETIMAATKLPKQTIRTALQDLACHGIVTQGGGSGGWRIAEQWKDHITVAYPHRPPGSILRSVAMGGARAGTVNE
jgi:hypothetical protein